MAERLSSGFQNIGPLSERFGLKAFEIINYKSDAKKIRVEDEEVAEAISLEETEVDYYLDADGNFGVPFKRSQLQILLKPRLYHKALNSKDILNANFPEGLSSSLRQLHESVEACESICIVEVPNHTVGVYLHYRICFDKGLSSFLAVLNKEEFSYFGHEIGRFTDVIQHEQGPSGIGKSVLAYTYGNLIF